MKNKIKTKVVLLSIINVSYFFSIEVGNDFSSSDYKNILNEMYISLMFHTIRYRI